MTGRLASRTGSSECTSWSAQRRRPVWLGLLRHHTFTSSHSASSLPSTDFDTESAWSLPRHGGGGMTLANLIGLVDAMESRRRPSARASRSGKLRALLLSLCLRSHLESGSGAPSLREFLEMERRASGDTSDITN
ncbi:unnamed protein product [Urochloa humidicola]